MTSQEPEVVEAARILRDEYCWNCANFSRATDKCFAVTSLGRQPRKADPKGWCEKWRYGSHGWPFEASEGGAQAWWTR